MDFISNIGNKRNTRKTTSRRPYTRRTSISSVTSVNGVSNTNTTKKEKTLYSLNKKDVFPNYKPQQDVSGNSLLSNCLFLVFNIFILLLLDTPLVKPEKLWIDTEYHPSSAEEEDLFSEVAVSPPLELQ